MPSPLSRTTSTIVATRAPNDAAKAFEAYCAERGISRAQAMRQLMARATDLDLLQAALAAAKAGDNEAALVILQDLQEQQAAGSSTDGATGETPDRLPPEVRKLSAADLAYCKHNSVDPEDFAKRKAAAVRRVGRVRRL